MSESYLCIHGHFYQPPRENPWLGVIEAQPSARPYHDWNERITRECYAPNARARVLGPGGRITRLVNNYEYMSFNFGPTLLSWLEQADPWTYANILAADRASMDRNDGHGNALAQVYNHIIMPLAEVRDQLTQIRWGLRDFKHRFGRPAEGMWLAETAVNTETLELMAGEGIKFTILSPEQAGKIRPISDRTADWEDVGGGRIDPRRPYRVLFDKSGDRYIDVFFYDGPVSRAVAYERLLTSGAGFLERIERAAGGATKWPRLINLATDGESYGHHFQFGEMALAWVFDRVEKNNQIKILNYGAFLERFPPGYEVEIIDDTAWSCAHGIERWRSDCGCCAVCRPGWNQAWRTPLRDGLNELRDRLASIFEEHGQALLKDPWAARDDYVSVFLDPGTEAREALLRRHWIRPLNEEEKIKVLCLLGSQVMALFMFTSCGWFFDDIAGLEPVQNLKYADRAVDLVRIWAKTDLKAGLLEDLALAHSNDPAYKDGADVYRKMVEPARIGPPLTAAHFALRTLVGDGELQECHVSRTVLPLLERRLTGPGLTVVVGEVRVGHEWTGQTFDLVFLAIHQGGLGLSCRVAERTRTFDLKEVARNLQPAVSEVSPDRVKAAFLSALPRARRYDLADLIPDSRHALVEALAHDIRDRFRAWIREFFETHQDILLVLDEVKGDEPDEPAFIYKLAVGDQLMQLLESGLGVKGLNWKAFKALADRAKSWAVPLNRPDVAYLAKSIIRNSLETLTRRPDQETTAWLIDFLRLIKDLNLGLDLWDIQNNYYDFYYQAPNNRPPELDVAFIELGRELGFAV